MIFVRIHILNIRPNLLLCDTYLHVDQGEKAVPFPPPIKTVYSMIIDYSLSQ